MAQPTLRPLSVFETIDAAFSLYRKHFTDLVTIAAIILIPLGIIGYLVSLPTTEFASIDPNEVPDISDFNFTGLIGGSILAAIVSVGGTALLTGSATNIVASSYLERVEGWRESLQEAIQKLGSLVGSAILAALGTGLGLLLCIIPGVYLYVSWVTAPVTIMVEDEGATGALGRSRDLVSGRWGSVFGVLLILFILQFIISAVLGAIIGAGSIIGGSALTAGQLAASQVASTVTSILVQPFLAVVITVVYFDLRVRKEGFDLDQLARRMGGEPPAAGGGMPGGTDPSPDPGPGPITPPPPPPPTGGDPFS